MESTHSEQETRELAIQKLIKVTNELKDIKLKAAPLENVKSLFQQEPPKPESRLEIARKLASDVATNAKNLDKSIENIGMFFESVLDTELVSDTVDKEVTKAGFAPPTESDFGIPNALDEQSIERFELATNHVVSAPDSELRKQAMFLVSFCNQLIFERQILDGALLKSREATRKAACKIMELHAIYMKASCPAPNYRRFG